MGTSALILVDIQAGFQDERFWGARNNPGAEAAAGRLLAGWRAAGAPVVHIRHVSVQAGSPLTGPGTAFHPAVTPLNAEPVFEKSVNSAFIGTPLEGHLRGLGVTRVVIAGLTTPHCVSTTTRMAANLGFGVRLAHDACASFTSNADASWRGETGAIAAEVIHDAAISHLHGEFAQAMSVDAILAEGP